LRDKTLCSGLDTLLIIIKSPAINQAIAEKDIQLNRTPIVVLLKQ